MIGFLAAALADLIFAPRGEQYDEVEPVEEVPAKSSGA
jgi:hypothetical protein